MKTLTTRAWNIEEPNERSIYGGIPGLQELTDREEFLWLPENFTTPVRMRAVSVPWGDGTTKMFAQVSA